MQHRLLVASTNHGKLVELRQALAHLPYEVVTLAEAGHGGAEGPDETGRTFEENALLKARFFHARTGLATVADDSGLEVDILGGRPGVQSARYGTNDADRIRRLLGEMEGVPVSERGARFVCAIALVGDGVEEVFRGECEGRIRYVPAGANGFGYDPVFEPSGDSRTFAEMPADEKHAVSHRGRAMAALAAYLDSAED